MNNLRYKDRAIKIIGEAKPFDYSIGSPFDRTLVEGQRIVIYSAGITGKLAYRLLKHLGYEVIAFLDVAADKIKNLYGLPVYNPFDEGVKSLLKSCGVIIALDKFKYSISQIIKELKDLGYEHVTYSDKVMAKSNFYHFSTIFDLSRINLWQEREKILAAMELMSDEHSQEVFLSFLNAYASSDFNSAIISHDTVSYVKPDVPFSKGFSKFVDCGAYTGDTFISLVQHKKVDCYIAFEPVIKNFSLLSRAVENCTTEIHSVYLYPCGVSDTNSYVTFNGELDGASLINDKGAQTIQVVRLDDIIKGQPPTMIKMDIEGAEIQALNGCRQLIKNYFPDLAVCVYHKLSDLWEIPLLVKEIFPRYKFYLRCHGIGTLETILYATA